MNLEDCKVIFVALGLIGILLFASPTLALILHLPNREKFSELWILGSGHMAEDYPFNVKFNTSEVFKVYLGVANHMCGLEYYRVYVKFRNQTEPLPDIANGTPSPLEPLYEYQAFLRDGEVWEREILFSFEDVSFEDRYCRVSSLVVDDYVLNVNKSIFWNEENNGFYCQLLFELWIYNTAVSDFQFHNRFVELQLNMTA